MLSQLIANAEPMVSRTSFFMMISLCLVEFSAVAVHALMKSGHVLQSSLTFDVS